MTNEERFKQFILSLDNKDYNKAYSIIHHEDEKKVDNSWIVKMFESIEGKEGPVTWY